MKKNTRVDWIDRNIHDCLNAGIPVHLFFMIGFPTETKEEALNTLAYTENVLNYSNRYVVFHIPREDLRILVSLWGRMFGIIPISMVSL